ncbi:synembryn-A isoform X2 [Suncus etruscus]|uniref:synembryn-A isoform X2 n=1 Tax=Suncus etruscus TaxID=109475 RepID=UPI002110E620|nr:synembryn-A isoform X2 [Suncus etruscus]
MEPRAVADAVEAGPEDAALGALRAYNREHCQSFAFDAAQQQDRQRLAGLLAAALERGVAGAGRGAWLQSVRILTRDPGCLRLFARARSLHALAQHAGADPDPDADPDADADPDPDPDPDADPAATLEALKCLCNLVLSSPAAQLLAAEAGLAAALLERVARAHAHARARTHGHGHGHDLQFFDLRLLFLLTALRPDVRRRLADELRGVRVLTAALERTLALAAGGRDAPGPPERLPAPETERAMEVLKVLFNITLDSGKREADEEDAALYRHLGTLLRHCVMITSAGDRTEEFHGHTVNLLGNLPLRCLDVLLSLELKPDSLEFLGMNMDVICALLSFLEKRLQQTHRLKESVAPVLSVLTECARMHRPARKFLKAQVLPPLRDVRNRPEVGELLRNKLVRLMTHLDTDVKRVAAEFLFVLCSESVPRFIKYTGYGNAAGLLAARGLMAGGRPEGQYSEDEDTDTDEYKEAKASINPVTGRVEEKPPNPMEGMTEEQKEHEAMKLVNMFDKLSRHRVIQPMGMSPQGQLTPLQDALCETMEGQLSSDPDSDPD